MKGDSKVMDNEGICHISTETERSVYAAFEFPAYKKSLVVGISSRGNQHTAPLMLFRCWGDWAYCKHLAEMERLRHAERTGRTVNLTIRLLK